MTGSFEFEGNLFKNQPSFIMEKIVHLLPFNTGVFNVTTVEDILCIRCCWSKLNRHKMNEYTPPSIIRDWP